MNLVDELLKVDEEEARVSFEPKKDIFKSSSTKFIFLPPLPVSYTHLDVYKRQDI